MALPTRVNRTQQYQDPMDAFESALGHFFGRQQDGSGYMAPYGVDVREDGDHIYVEADLPGFKKEDVDITLENQTLTITAERKDETKQGPKGELLLNERRYRRFQRSFTLPPTVDESSVNAKLADGILTIVLNKREETKPRKIQVS